jgi:hypothetical protein
MPDLPEYMLKKDKPTIDHFAPDEYLYRRVPDEFWDDEEIELDSIDFPDMSVTRESLAPATSARWIGDEYVDWGVIGFQVSDMPAEIRFQGAYIYRMKAVHAPLKRNYPHSEVRIFESKWDRPDEELHVDKQAMPGVPREAQQEWREMIRRRSRIILRPGEEPGEG